MLTSQGPCPTRSSEARAGNLVAGEAQERQTAGAAVRDAQRMAGTVAFSRTGVPASGEFEDAIVIKRFADVPDMGASLLA